MNTHRGSGQAHELEREVLRFNLEPLANLDQSWLEAVSCKDVFLLLRDTPDAWPWLSQHLLNDSGLANSYWEEFSPQRARLALLPRDTIQVIFLYVGLTVRGPEFRSQIAGETLKELRDEIGAEALEFVFRTAPLLGTPPSFALEVDTNTPLRSELILLGALYCAYRAAAKSDAYLKRLALKLPKEIADDFFVLARSSEAQSTDEQVPPLVMRVIREVAPRCLHLLD